MIRSITVFVFLIISVLPAAAQIKIQEVISPAGIKAWLVEEPSIPFIALDLSFRGGTALDSAEKQGATNLMMGLLEEGTGDMDAAAFRKATETLAAGYSFKARQDATSVSARFLTENAAASLDLLKQAITYPAFNETAFERVKGQVLSGLNSKKSDPDAIAAKTMDELAFNGHPYGRSNDGTIETVTALTPQDMVDAHQNSMSLDHLVVGVVGDVTAEELGPMLDELLGELPTTGAKLPADVPFAATGGTTVVEFNTPQSVAIWAQPGIDRHHPDFIAAFVMNHILGGGGFGSRLTDEVREKRGLTYGIYSYVASMDHANLVGGSVASSNRSVGEAIEVVKQEWAAAASGDFTEKELSDAQKYITGSYPLRFDANAKIARMLVGLQLDFLPIDYVNTRNDKVMALTLDDINRTAKELLNPDNLRFVVVGKPEGVTSTD